MAPANVNRPTDVKQKEADVNRKLQLYGIVNAFQNGKVPSNDQIDVALNSFLESSALSGPSDKLSAEGKALVADVREVVKQAKLLLLSKNEGNLLQDFIWETQHFDPKQVNVPGAPVDKDTAKQHGDKALEGLRTLGTLIITNGQFRKLLKDATTLLRDMAGDAATHAATKVKPSEEALSQIDEPAEDNVWHEAPDFSKDNLKNQLQSMYKGDAKKEAQDVAHTATASAHPNGRSDPTDLAQTAAYDQQNGTSSGINAQGGLNAASDAISKNIDAKIDPEKQKELKENAKETARQYRARVKEYFGKKVPQERKDQTIWRLKKVLVEVQQHPDYQQAIETLLDLLEEYGSHANKMAKGGAGTAQDARSNLARAEKDLKTLIERFANGTSTDTLWSSINQIYKDADQDPELKNWFKAFDGYIRKCLKEQGYVLEEESTAEWNRLYDRGHYLLRTKYRTHTDKVFDEIKFIGDQFDKDAQNRAFAAALTKLFTDLGNDQDGKPTFKPHLIKDLTEVIIPATLKEIAYIPVPRIEYSDPQMDAVIENLVLESDNFMPNVLTWQTNNMGGFDRSGKGIKPKSYHSVEINVKGIQLDLRDVSYYVKKKEGFPSLSDVGVADILLAGDGFGFKLKLSTAEDKDSQHFFKIDKVDVDVKHLSVKLAKSKHKLLFSLFKPLLLKVLSPAIQKAMEKTIRDQVDKLDTLLFQIKQEADRALQEAQNDPDNIPNIYARYVSAAQKQFLQSKQKAQQIAAAAAEKKVNMAVTKEESIFPDIHLPGGISSKATEYKQLARSGEKWESPVFSIGKAGKSEDVPSAPAVEVKQHEKVITPAPTTAPAGNGNAAKVAPVNGA